MESISSINLLHSCTFNFLIYNSICCSRHIHMFYYLIDGTTSNMPHTLHTACLVSYRLSCIVDAWIYIITQKSVIRWIRRNTSGCNCCGNGNVKETYILGHRFNITTLHEINIEPSADVIWTVKC